MKLAKTNQAEMESLLNLLNEVEWLHKELTLADFDQIDFSEHEILKKFDNSNAEAFLNDLVRNIASIYFQRIIWNAMTLIDNCTDPDLSHLDFNKEIKAGLELLEKSKTESLMSANVSMAPVLPSGFEG